MIYDEDIISAISSRKKIKINYKKRGDRIICPHVLYISAAGKKTIDAYQTSGYSEIDKLPQWKSFSVSEINELSILNETFDIAPRYNPSNREKYVTIIARI